MAIKFNPRRQRRKVQLAGRRACRIELADAIEQATNKFMLPEYTLGQRNALAAKICKGTITKRRPGGR